MINKSAAKKTSKKVKKKTHSKKVSKQSWTLYIIETDKGSLYTGITTDLERRFSEHQNGKKGAKFFHSQKAVKICYQESCKNRSLASKREAFIKSLTRVQKLNLIANT
ncbi:MAG: GIY-YIG nuclease family protein [Bacteriovoracaceae bacterium]